MSFTYQTRLFLLIYLYTLHTNTHFTFTNTEVVYVCICVGDVGSSLSTVIPQIKLLLSDNPALTPFMVISAVPQSRPKITNPEPLLFSPFVCFLVWVVESFVLSVLFTPSHFFPLHWSYCTGYNYVKHQVSLILILKGKWDHILWSISGFFGVFFRKGVFGFFVMGMYMSHFSPV